MGWLRPCAGKRSVILNAGHPHQGAACYIRGRDMEGIRKAMCAISGPVVCSSAGGRSGDESPHELLRIVRRASQPIGSRNSNREGLGCHPRSAFAGHLVVLKLYPALRSRPYRCQRQSS